ncbi:metal resistance protein [Pseudovibrio japonicus]|uniref:Metal resistance protein n=1 Tax=Pseudovibrio japonicus TaxID=366534 RepID=A0ABQ3ETQ6_9HYPH|nr:metal-sensing transcriptional repressor [Pseudovibrio japonicus]GHB46556.1 metal resistance protein [Pseudovibrio japonicus]
MTEKQQHQSHPGIVNRLKRADGHLRSIIDMIEDGRPCVEIAQQLHAVERAVMQAKKTLIYDHLDHCLDETIVNQEADSKQTIEEFKAISRYL